jgi:hypothetical protein
MNEDSLQGGFTHDPGEYLNRVGDFLRGLPVEHSVLLSNAVRRAQREQINEADLWLWVEAGNQVVAAAQHTPPHGAYLSTGPSEAMRVLAQMLWEQRPWLPGVAGPTPSPEEFADEWANLGGPIAVLESREGTHIASQVHAPTDVLGALRIAEPRDADLLRAWAAQFMAETELTTSDEDLIGPRMEPGRMFNLSCSPINGGHQRGSRHQMAACLRPARLGSCGGRRPAVTQPKRALASAVNPTTGSSPTAVSSWTATWSAPASRCSVRPAATVPASP